MTPILKILLTAIVSLVFAALAHFHIVLPNTFTRPGLLAVFILVASTASIIWRAEHGSILEDALTWWKSKIIWTNLVAIGFAVLALFGIVPALDQADVVTAVMAIAGMATGGLALTSTRPIG